MSDSWIDHLQVLLAVATDRLSAEASGPPSYGVGARTIGQPVTVQGESLWLRVVSDAPAWAQGPAWEGNVAANAINGVPRPAVRDIVEWDDGDLRVRAELQTLAPSPALSRSVTPPSALALDSEWWTQLRAALGTLASQPTDRVCLDPRLLERRIRAFFGVALGPANVAWTTAHGDLQWSNVTGPTCWLLDWEAWGTAPAGYDAATLYCASLVDERLAAHVHEQLADLLDTRTGQVAQLAAAAKLLGLVEHGEHPGLAAPLHSHARALLRRG